MSEEFDEDVYGEGVDNDAHNESGNEDDGDEFEKMLEVHRKDIWSTGGLKKDETVRELIKCFGSMIESHPKEYAIPDHSGKYKTEDMLYTKLLDAPKYVTKAKRALIENENFDTRNFSIFIANKRWAKNILRPLLELCAKDDSTLAMRCCGLALVLIRRLSETSQKILQDSTRGAKRKASSLDLQQNEDEKEDDEKLKAEKGMNAAAIDEDAVRKEKAALLMRIENVKQQVSALLSFKDALCSDKCNEAMTNAFKELWLKEQIATTEENKMGVAICFSYLRRILAIDSHPQWSTPGEIQLHRSIHDKYIVQLRLLLSVVPGICSDILRSYHNDWLGDIILIIYFTLRGFEPKDLYRVWRTGALIEDFENLDSYDTTVDADGLTGATAGHRAIVDVVVPTALAQSAAQQSSAKGKLTQLLQRDRNARLQVPGGRGAGGVMAGAAARFRGVYQRPVAHTAALPALPSGASGGNTSSELDHILGSSVPRNPASGATGAAAAGTNASNADGAEPVVQCHLQVSKIVRDPFQLSGAAVPPVQAKRNRRNLTFSLDTTLSEVTGALYQSSVDHQKAAVVAATLVNLLSNELSLKPLVKRVNEDLRRDDMRVGQDLELRYFDILYRVLHYNRLKLAEEYRQFQGSANTSGGWEPNLKNVMDALDRMSFTRVVTGIERMSKNPQHNDDVVVAMALYKEMVCYLRVLLESSLEGHHEIAIAALHRLFYAASEKLDPLPKLLSAWKSGTYPRRHLTTLVELVHETLKTLEVAQIRFRPEGDKNAEEWARRKYKKKGGKNEMDLEQYVMACMRFKVDDYFKRIVSSHTVRMYTKLLSHYDKNDSETNYHAYCFLRRMNAFTLEQDHKAPPPPPSTTNNNTAAALESAHSDEVSLGFMLFNIHTLEVFSTIVNDRTMYDNKQMEPLLRLILAILRRFGEAANKNRMLFVELLFQQPRPHDFCCQLDSVYEAPSHAAYVNAAHKRDKNFTTRDAESSAGSGSDSSTDSDEGDYGDEFDENNISAAFAATISEKAKAKAAREAARAAKKAARAEKKQGKGGSRQARREEKKARLAARQAEKQEARASKYAWSAEEDAVLKDQYALYAGTRSVFTSIAQHPDLKALGRNRSEAQVAKRVKQLELHMQISFSDDEGDGEEAELDVVEPSAGSASNSDGEVDEDQDSNAEDAGQKRRKVIEDPDFGGILFSDEDDGEMEVETAPLETQRSVVATQLDTQRATQQATQASTLEQRQLLSAFSAQSPVHTTKNRRPERTGRSTGAGSKDSENYYAHIFSPSDSSLNLEEEGDETQPTQPQRAPSQTASTQPQVASATQGSSAPIVSSKTTTSAKKPKLRESAPSAAPPSTAFWDQDDGVDIFEQRSMALLQARGGAGIASDDDSLLDARASNKRPPAKGLVKKAVKKTKSSRTAAASNSDAEDDLFGTGEGDAAPVVTAEVPQEAQQEQKKAMFKKRLMRIDSDEE